MSKPDLLMATMNLHKFREAAAILAAAGIDQMISLKNMKDVGFDGEIPEDEATLEGNASSKSMFVYQHYGIDCFSDDTGLEVEALNGAPGVYSARYAGEDGNAEKNIIRLLKEMQDIPNRNARFRTVISLIIKGKEYQFEGIVEGTIMQEKEGRDGFGYDPVFMPLGYDCSFASMPLSEKNSISHRYQAIRKMADFLLAKRDEL